MPKRGSGARVTEVMVPSGEVTEEVAAPVRMVVVVRPLRPVVARTSVGPAACSRA
ncbi:MAG: hypothetical protein IPG04_12815 [Polyangiaceae bacterium]|nr:hypothetical protein [Polyangiaceae bacterium]